MALHNREQNWAWGNPQSVSYVQPIRFHRGSFSQLMVYNGVTMLTGS